MLQDGMPDFVTMTTRMGQLASLVSSHVLECRWSAITIIEACLRFTARPWLMGAPSESASRPIVLRFTWAGASDRGRALLTGMRKGEAVRRRLLIVPGARTIAIAAGQNAAGPQSANARAQTGYVTAVRPLASPVERSASSARHPLPSTHVVAPRRPCAQKRVDAIAAWPQLTRLFPALDDRCGAPKPARARLCLAPAAPDASDRPVLMVKGLNDITVEGSLLDVFAYFGQARWLRERRQPRLELSCFCLGAGTRNTTGQGAGQQSVARLRFRRVPHLSSCAGST